MTIKKKKMELKQEKFHTFTNCLTGERFDIKTGKKITKLTPFQKKIQKLKKRALSE